jgi:hypothetical protein
VTADRARGATDGADPGGDLGDRLTGAGPVAA